MQITKTMVFGAYAVCALIIAILEFTFHESGSLMYSLLFFAALSQGPLAIVAAADIVNSGWVKPYKREMFSVRHMMLFVALLFLIFALSGKVHLYDWAHHENGWLNQNFFIIRNLAMLVLAWLVAGKYQKESLSESDKKAKWGVIWVFAYVAGQSLIAFDWVMSLDYPWVSTLFGAYFFVEAFYAGLALAAVITYFNYHNFVVDFPEKTFKKSQMDMMTLMFGFSIFWAYQFFSQYLVIWYGNIPEEVGYLTHRLDEYSATLYLVLIILFIIPFWTLLSRKIKANPRFSMIIGFLILGGILLERFFMIAPRLSLHPVITPVEFALTALAFLFTVIFFRGSAKSAS